MPDQEKNIYIVESGSNENGSYIKYSNGKLKQMGKGSGDASVGNITIELPTAFSDTSGIVSITNIYTNYPSINYSASVDKTKLYVFARIPTTDGYGKLVDKEWNFQWTAEGYWK